MAKGQNNQIDIESLKLIFKETKEQLDMTFKLADNIRVKASLAMGFVGVLLGILLSSSSLFSNYMDFECGSIGGLLVFISLFLLLDAFIVAYLGYRIETKEEKKYKKPPKPRSLVEIDDFWFSKYEDLMQKLIFQYVDSYEHNKRIIAKKAEMVNLSFLILACSLGLLIISLAWR